MRRVAGRALKQRLKALLHSRWFQAGFLLQLASVLIFVLFFINPRWFDWTVALVECFAPTIDAPDSWAIAVTCLFGSCAVVFAGGVGCYVVAWWRNGMESNRK
jgi:hypothetical protein